jgi:Carbohydrate family 9 binding domain-like
MQVEHKTYYVKNIQDEQLIVNGKGDHLVWNKAHELSDFAYPWENERATSTSFKALHNKDWLYCLFKVCVNSVKVYVNTENKLDVLQSDRVEIFFRRDDRLSTYYCLELDPLARVLDYEAAYYRKFNMQWSYPTGQLVVKADRKMDGYAVEIAIRKDSLRKLEVLKNGRIDAGLFRGECVEINETEPTMKWISWVSPDSETPDFHIASSFGVLILED